MNPSAEYKALPVSLFLSHINIWQFLLDMFGYTKFKLYIKTNLFFANVEIFAAEDSTLLGYDRTTVGDRIRRFRSSGVSSSSRVDGS
jgi:hypothetical protein